jgi:HPt (histidine-containing phosphotransfer) domain-containing protein
MKRMASATKDEPNAVACAAAPGRPAIDEAAYAAMSALAALDPDPDALSKLVRAFVARATATVDEIARALARAEHATVGREAHGLKSSAAMFGAFEVARVCVELDRAAEERPASTASLAALSTALRHAEAELSERLDRRG